MLFMINVPVSSVAGVPSETFAPSSITEINLSFAVESRDIGIATSYAKGLLDTLAITTTSFNIELVVAPSGPYEEHA